MDKIVAGYGLLIVVIMQLFQKLLELFSDSTCTFFE